MQDTELVAHIRFACARLRVERGGLGSEEAGVIAAELAESFELLVERGRADGVAVVGALLGPIMLAAGATAEAQAVLDDSANAFEQIGMPDRAAALQQLAESGSPAADEEPR